MLENCASRFDIFIYLAVGYNHNPNVSLVGSGPKDVIGIPRDGVDIMAHWSGGPGMYVVSTSMHVVAAVVTAVVVVSGYMLSTDAAGTGGCRCC